MTKSKKALISSAFSMLVCVAMLIGTTFAWFTDTASTGVNKIQAGTLKVDIINQAGDSLKGEQLKWQSKDGRAQENILWEPDCTYFLEPFMIQNKGNLALKYKIIINGVTGDNKLLEALDFGFYYFSPGFGASRSLDELVEGGKLDNVSEYPGLCTAPIYIYAHMKEEAGNEYKGLSIDGIGITVVATQYTYEKDSIDDQYDKDATYAWDGVTAVSDWYNETDSEFVINNANELAGVSKLAGEGNTFEGKKLELNKDVDLGNKKWTPINNFKGEFDGNGKTITGLKLDSTEGEKPRAGLFNVIEAGSKIHDLKIDGVEATVGKNGRVGVLGNSVKGYVEDIEIKNIKVTATDPTAWVGGLCAFMSWPAIKNCTVENMEVSAPNGAAFIAGFSPIMQKNANFTFENCNVKNFKVNVADNFTKDGCGVGGFIGQTQRGWEQPKMYNCHVTGIDITAAGNVDIGGFMPWPGGHTIAENCSASGKIDATGVNETGSAGGFFGNLGWNCDLGHMGHEITDCTANVDIVTKNAPAGGFVGTATNSNGSSMYATFKGCKALGNVTCVSGGTASVGGFAGVADRGYYENCSVAGKVSGGAVNGGFIGTVKHIDAKYDGRFPVGTREYEVEQITVKSCAGASGLELIGMDDQSNKDSLKRYHDIIIK